MAKSCAGTFLQQQRDRSKQQQQQQTRVLQAAAHQRPDPPSVNLVGRSAGGPPNQGWQKSKKFGKWSRRLDLLARHEARRAGRESDASAAPSPPPLNASSSCDVLGSLFKKYYCICYKKEPVGSPMPALLLVLLLLMLPLHVMF